MGRSRTSRRSMMCFFLPLDLLRSFFEYRCLGFTVFVSFTEPLLGLITCFDFEFFVVWRLAFMLPRLSRFTPGFFCFRMHFFRLLYILFLSLWRLVAVAGELKVFEWVSEVTVWFSFFRNCPPCCLFYSLKYLEYSHVSSIGAVLFFFFRLAGSFRCFWDL